MSNKLTTLVFDDSRARTYRKTVPTMAVKSSDPFTFRKSWGVQNIPANGYVMIELVDGKPNGNVYGCDGGEFDNTYIPSLGGPRHNYIKKATITAYQPGHPFKFNTVVGDNVEVADGTATDHTSWAAKNPGGEIYIIDNETFERTYGLVDKT